MAIGKINGPMLFSNLERQGVNLSIDANLVYFDVNNRYVGINNSSPAYALDAPGTARLANLLITGNTITSNTGKINLGSTNNIVITGGSLDYVLITDGNGNLTWSNISSVISATGLSGNLITLGANTVQSFVSNAVTLTSSTTVTNALAELNYVLGKLVPPSPPNFPSNQTLAISSATTSALMCNFTQTDNSGWGNLSITGGTPVSVVRSATYATTSITNVGPGSLGTVTAYLNGVPQGNVTLTGSNTNTTNGNLYVYNVEDYHAVVSTVTAGFWTVFSAQATGTVPGGWSRVTIGDTGVTANTNSVSWYTDLANPGYPTFSNTSVALTTNSVIYSSTIPMFTSLAQFTIKGNVSALSGDTYPNSSFLSTGSTSGAFQVPASVTYTAASVTTPLARNLYVGSGSAYFQTTANIITTGFGLSSVGPTVTVNNSYLVNSTIISPGVTILYKNGTGNTMEENAIPVSGSLGGGYNTNGLRIVNPDAGTATDNPIYTGSEAAFISQTGPFYTTDSTFVANTLKFDQTNYSTGYLPVGPNLSTQGASQYFTFKFQRTTVSKFNIVYTGALAGLWIALPGVTDASYATPTKGWLTMASAYAGAGVPGTGTGGNGSAGCAVGGTATLNSLGSYSLTGTFGTASSSSSTNNEIYVRIKLTSGQSLTALSISTPTN
jgi:hypothetical protein